LSAELTKNALLQTVFLTFAHWVRQWQARGRYFIRNLLKFYIFWKQLWSASLVYTCISSSTIISYTEENIINHIINLQPMNYLNWSFFWHP